ncbi:MAG: YihA family ribosome biogenesis GTP-binding protein [Oscillospiraceae bacterium]|nr:YihA family ribosome biogenesis GTP-binding protein [Oscillospiraceae bacterium]
MNFNKAEFYRSYGTFSQLPPSELPEFAFSGRSNVGKSSLINKIFNRKSLAKVSSVPGKTATINFYSLDGCFMVDLPGYGYAKVAKSDKDRWSGLIEGYLNSDRQLMLVFQLIDMRHPPSKDDMMMLEYLIETECPFVIVFTKADKLSKKQREERLAGFAKEIPSFEDITSIVFSAETGEGADEIRSIISELAENDQ